MATPSHDELRALLAAYALGALGDDESRTLFAHLADCAECRQELRAFQETVLRLVSSLEPPMTVWDRIVRRIRESPDT